MTTYHFDLHSIRSQENSQMTVILFNGLVEGNRFD